MQRFLTFFLPALFIWHAPAIGAEPVEAGLAARIGAYVETLQALSRGTARANADDVALFYAQRGHAPVWVEPGRLARLAGELERLVDDGLVPADYALATLPEMPADADALALRDVQATRTYLLALADVAFGRTERSAVEPLWRASAEPRSAARDVLVMRAGDGLDDLAAVFDAARPDTPLYRGLRAEYARLRDPAVRDGPWPMVPAGPPALREGDEGTRVALLRERLAREGYLPEDTGAADAAKRRFDAALTRAVMAFQHTHQLEVDGVVGQATLAVLNLPFEVRLDRLRVNLERARWLAADIEPHMLLVDVAGARLTYYRDAQPVWETRIQVGRASRPTPLLKSEITHFTFNPTWTVPPTILRQDKLPEIRRDIGYLAENRMRVLDHTGRELDPEGIDWSRPGAILLRQDAGPDNALGQVAIRFPNPFHVYLHDTPSQRLFGRDRRTTSSGCVRVEHALELVDHLIADAGLVSRDTVAELLERGRTRNVNLARPVPVLIAYWTADVGPDGAIAFRPDVYQRDANVLRALDTPRPLPELLSPLQ